MIPITDTHHLPIHKYKDSKQKTNKNTNNSNDIYFILFFIIVTRSDNYNIYNIKLISAERQNNHKLS